MKRESRPPIPKKTRLVTTYRSPIRLWSTVVTHDATRPRFQSARYGWISVLTATEPSLQVGRRRLHHRRVPGCPDRRHLVLAVPEQVLERLRVGGDRAA